MDPNTHAFAPTVDSKGRVIGVDLVRKDNSAVVVSPDLDLCEAEMEEHSDVEAALAALRAQPPVDPDNGPGEEDGPWAPGWAERSAPGSPVQAIQGMVPADGSSWAQWARRNTVVTAALIGGATNAEANQLAHLDAITDIPADQKQTFLREQFALMVGARVCGVTKPKPTRHRVAKRYRARGRW